ncbi:MAG: hypothetical protein KDM81_14395, partial [Verrucomicrobiae bacterium]|nr:hypothetical protein [Verrucomicrobiae bacterium]
MSTIRATLGGNPDFRALTQREEAVLISRIAASPHSRAPKQPLPRTAPGSTQQPWSFAAALTAGLLLVAGEVAADSAEWTSLPPLPDPLGVAGPFAGVSHGALLVGGGANFPDGPPWDGGRKVWHDTVYVLPAADGAWQTAGTLPRPLAYGVSLTVDDGVLCVGGSDATEHHAEVFHLHWEGDRLKTESLP